MQEKVKNALVRIARKSPKARREVISTLIDRLRGETLTRKSGKGRSAVWFAVADALGELHAVEAIDVLVENLDYNPGWTTVSLLTYPTVRAVIQIGDAAVPRLEQTLLSAELGAGFRINAARALGEIQGTRAYEALLKALQTENDPAVISCIKGALDGMNKTPR